MNYGNHPLVEFFSSGVKNSWVSVGPYDAYMRRGTHLVQGSIVKTIDLANVANRIDSLKGQGWFSDLLDAIEDLTAYEALSSGTDTVFVESVINQDLESFLENRGYTKASGIFPPSFFKKISRECSGVWEEKISMLESLKNLHSLAENQSE